MTKQEEKDATLLMIRHIADDAGIAVNKLIEEGNINVLFQSAEDRNLQSWKSGRLKARHIT